MPLSAKLQARVIRAGRMIDVIEIAQDEQPICRGSGLVVAEFTDAKLVDLLYLIDIGSTDEWNLQANASQATARAVQFASGDAEYVIAIASGNELREPEPFDGTEPDDVAKLIGKVYREFV
tara:strand:+ start:300 stop:662 length:363 start_codon:yes stop_codon:yes gene_type:complete